MNEPRASQIASMLAKIAAPYRQTARAVGAVLLCGVAACGGDAATPTTSPGAAAGASATTAASAPSSQPASSSSTSSASKPATASSPASASASSPSELPTSAAGSSAANGGGAGILPCGVSKALATNCQNCHGAMPIGGAPMALMTYGDLMKPAVTQPSMKVYQLVQKRIHDTMRPMPPTNTLPASDMSALDGWLMAGAQPGPASDAACAAPPVVQDNGGGVAASRDFTTGRLTPLPGETCYEFKVHGSQTMVDDSKFDVSNGEFYEQFYFKAPWPANTVATAYATLADNAAVLHHWLLFSTNENQAEGAHIQAPLPTLIGNDPVLLAGWAVGGPNVVAPDDVGFELPDPGRTINVQWHFYNSTGSPQQDASSLQICTVPKSTRSHIANVTWLGTEDLGGNKWFGGEGMPAHMESTFTTSCTPGRNGLGPNDTIHVLGFEPHMHRIGKHMQTSVKHADGTTEMIFDKPFTFGSETHYPTSFDLKPGEQFITSCTFFNDNDFGVPFGESTDTEMCYQFTWAYPAHSLSNGAASLLGVSDTCW